ncbi:trehalase isoform X2 [Fopius arisanus]|uniref:Trehalase n=2 Tax=Fopius arisanus TaxID=64838 RepID=A0A0C9S020_9HYME|nr:PREDICTED: trehalase-like isoform X2 [Fopius arisanus]XP_011308385.1 PREDICTED: trehalase-like isoform X2 [Fopius arisanus]
MYKRSTEIIETPGRGCRRYKLLVRAFWLTIVLVQSVTVDSTRDHEDSSRTHERPPPCSSEIYCHGELLHTVQMAQLYTDSKTFVDMKMKKPAAETLAAFRKMMNDTNHSPSLAEIQYFVNNTFDPPGSEFETWIPGDWRVTPKFLASVKDRHLRKFASDLNDIWKMLGRKMKDDVRINENLYSIIYVPYPVIVPGGRFREFYYWDSYWIMKGLLLSEMYTTVKGMLTNFVTIVDKIGLIPNGGRIYYEMRSHPPMLIPMVKDYLDVTKDYEWLKENLWLLEKEFEFWMTNRTVEIEKDGRNYTLARYYESSKGPRPESYREDYRNGELFRISEERENYYMDLKTAAESGWDFSSRWFILDGTNKGNLSNIKTRYIVPVELNAIIYYNAVLLADFNDLVGNMSKAAMYRSKAEMWKTAVNAVLWHEEVGVWLDYDLLNDMKRDYFYPTNVVPLWTNCYDITKREDYVGKVLKYLERNQIMVNLGGIPATLELSGEQWDYPNAWPPLQYFVIESLDNTGDAWAQRLAYEMSERWVRSNFKAFNATNSMYEKYDATVSGGGGGGGEYEVQLGFGWSNGLVMHLINKYGDRLAAEDRFSPYEVVKETSAAPSVTVSTAGQMMTGLIAVVISLAAGYIGWVVYKRRHYYVPGPSTMAGIKRKSGAPGDNFYRKHIAYTELKDMNND